MKRLNSSKGFTLPELIVAVAVIGFLSAAAIPAFTSYMYKAKAAEAPGHVANMAKGEVSYFHKNETFLAAGPTGIPPSSGLKVSLDLSSDPNWALLGFDLNGPTYYGFEAELTSSTQVDCKAMGDLNGDGVTSLFKRTVTANSTGNISLSPIYIFDETE